MTIENIIATILILGAIQGVFISLVLFKSKYNPIGSKLLAGAIFTISVALFLAYFQVVLDYTEYTFQVKSIISLPLIFIPLLFLYTKVNTKELKEIDFKNLKYFIPFLVVFIYNIRFYLGSSADKIAYFERENIYSTSFLTDRIEIAIVNIIIFSFSIKIFSAVLKMRDNFENEVSNYQENIIKLMFILAVPILAFTSTSLTLSIFQILNIDYPSILDFITAIGSSFLIYMIAYYSILNPQIFGSLNKVSDKTYNISIEESKDSLLDDYLVKINKLMEDGKIYRNSDLTLQSFSDELKIPSYLVSKIINTKIDLNFYNFVNKFRIEEVKHNLKETKNPKILQIAFDAGFNTKSSFYNYFKKDTGMSPKDFIKNTSNSA